MLGARPGPQRLFFDPRALVLARVEDVEVLNQLRALGCDLAQGYQIAKPLPAAEIGLLVKQYESRTGRVRLSAVTA